MGRKRPVKICLSWIAGERHFYSQKGTHNTVKHVKFNNKMSDINPSAKHDQQNFFDRHFIC